MLAADSPCCGLLLNPKNLSVISWHMSLLNSPMPVLAGCATPVAGLQAACRTTVFVCPAVCMMQMLAAMGDSDDDLDGLDGPSSDDKPAGRRSKKAKRNEDSDFEVRCKMRSQLGWCNHCMLAQNAGGKALGGLPWARWCCAGRYPCSAVTEGHRVHHGTCSKACKVHALQGVGQPASRPPGIFACLMCLSLWSP